MARLLHIRASPRGEVSESLALATTFLTAYRNANPLAEVCERNLWDGTLPAFGPDAANAKMVLMDGASLTADQVNAWSPVIQEFRNFDAADRYLFSVPMWNFGVPYILKQFIDVISQPGFLFSFDPKEGYRGLLNGKKAAVIYTSAVYSEGRSPAFGSDHQATYLRDWLQWAGVAQIEEICFRPSVCAQQKLLRSAAHERARALAAAF